MINLKISKLKFVYIVFFNFLNFGVAQPQMGQKSNIEECTKEWSMIGQMKSKNYIYALGISTRTELSKAIEEAKILAYREVSTQLLSNVNSQSSLNETQDSAIYSGTVNLETNLKNLTGINIVKEGANLNANIKHCVVVKFDVSSAYSDSEGQMNVLEKQLKGIFEAAKSNKYIDVLQKIQNAREQINLASEQITRADMFRIYIGAESKSWYEKIKGQLADAEKVAEAAKKNIIFIINSSSEYEGVLGEIESKLTGEGFEVTKDSKTLKAVRLNLDIKSIALPRKTKTVLGETVIAKIAVTLKDQTGHVLATNKGAQVTGTGANDDEAVANIDRQLLVHVFDVLREGLPGLIQD